MIKPIFENAFLPIFFACDSNFLPHAITAICSIMENRSINLPLDIIILHENIPQTDINLSAQWFSQYPNCSLRFFDVSEVIEKIGKDHFPVTRNFPISIYYRLFAPEIFKDYHRIVYLDCDLLVLADICLITDTDIGAYYLAACHDYVQEKDLANGASERTCFLNRLGLKGSGEYFNSGVLYCNLNKMRSVGFFEKVKNLIGELPQSALPDQDLFNVITRGNVLYLADEWNMQEWMLNDNACNTKLRFVTQLIKDKCGQISKDCCILHFSEKKPWKYDYLTPYEEMYWYYLSRTPFYDRIAGQLVHATKCTNLILPSLHLLFQIARNHLLCLTASKRKENKYRRRIEAHYQTLVCIWKKRAHFRRITETKRNS